MKNSSLDLLELVLKENNLKQKTIYLTCNFCGQSFSVKYKKAHERLCKKFSTGENNEA